MRNESLASPNQKARIELFHDWHRFGHFKHRLRGRRVVDVRVQVLPDQTIKRIDFRKVACRFGFRLGN